MAGTIGARLPAVRVVIGFASFDGFAGCLTSARHAAAVLGGEAHALAPGDPPPRCDLIVLSSWHPSYEPLLDSPVRLVGRWHSPLLQAELGAEAEQLGRLLELRASGRMEALTFNDPVAARVFGGVHLPDVLADAPAVEPWALEGVNVTLLGEPYPRKNIVVQVAAFAAAAGPDWTLHLAGRADRYRRWLDLLDVPFVDHGRLEHDALMGLVAGCDAGLAATLSEAYGYVAAEHLQRGVPVVTSAAVPCADTGPLRVTNPGSVDDVAAALRLAIGADVAAAQASLRERAAANERIARAALAELAG
jgi:hypothetical protein